MRINLYDDADLEIKQDTENNKVEIKEDNAYCRCCGSNRHTIRLRSTNPKKSTGVTDLLYVARIAKKDILICPRCLASRPMLISNHGQAVMTYSNDKKKFSADMDLINKTRGEIDFSDFDY